MRSRNPRFERGGGCIGIKSVIKMSSRTRLAGFNYYIVWAIGSDSYKKAELIVITRLDFVKE